MTNFENSQTKVNLMRAFAGESQARNRYTFAESVCKKQQLYVLQALFKFTANQEKSHAWVFYSHITKLANAGERYNVNIEAGYPVDLKQAPIDLLADAVHNETEESDSAYPAFAKQARDEGFSQVAQSFENIAKVEQCHAKRFETFHSLMKDDKLFSSQTEETWMCLNCGYIMEGTKAPQKCPVCEFPQGYFIRCGTIGVILTVPLQAAINTLFWNHKRNSVKRAK